MEAGGTAPDPCVAYRREFLRQEHPETATILSNLGLAYYGQRKLDRAEVALRRALEIRRKTLAPGDPAVAISSFGLGLVLAARDRYDEAKSLYAASLQIQEKNFGPKTAEIAQMLEELAALLRKMKNPEEPLRLTRGRSLFGRSWNTR